TVWLNWLVTSRATGFAPFVIIFHPPCLCLAFRRASRAFPRSGIPQIGPIRAQFWLPSALLASWTRRNWRKTDRASGIGPIPRSKMAIFLSYGRTSPVSLSRTHDQSQDVGEEVFRNGDRGHLECDV